MDGSFGKHMTDALKLVAIGIAVLAFGIGFALAKVL